MRDEGLRPWQCDHADGKWEESRFWIKAEVTSEEPDYYPPQGLVRLEICTGCRMVRIPDDVPLECPGSIGAIEQEAIDGAGTEEDEAA